MNCVSPGSVPTPMTKNSYAKPEFVERIKKEVVFGYVGGPKDIAYPMVFLCSDLAKWAVGADLNVSGGQVIY